MSKMARLWSMSLIRRLSKCRESWPPTIFRRKTLKTLKRCRMKIKRIMWQTINLIKISPVPTWMIKTV